MREPLPMREIHQIQIKIYEENKHLSRKQQIEKTNRIAQEMIKQYGLKIQRSNKAA